MNDVPTLDPATRAVLRERVLAGLDETPDRRPWVVPLAAAAAVGVLAAGTGYVALGGDGDPRTLELATAGPASAQDPARAGGEPSGCDEFVLLYAGGRPPVARAGAADSTYAAVGGGWGLCDPDPAAIPEGPPADQYANREETILHLITMGGFETSMPVKPTTSLADYTSRGLAQVFLAAGTLPAGVDSIAYAFPDGSTEQAEISGQHWRMMHTATEGDLVDPAVDPTTLDPVTVTVSGPGGDETVTLEWSAG